MPKYRPDTCFNNHFVQLNNLWKLNCITIVDLFTLVGSMMVNKLPRTEEALGVFFFFCCQFFFFCCFFPLHLLLLHWWHRKDNTRPNPKGFSEITRKICPIIFNIKQLHNRKRFGNNESKITVFNCRRFGWRFVDHLQ